MDESHGPAADNAVDYAGLDPDCILEAVDGCGYVTDGRLLALNSYENRVYQVGIEDAAPVIAKFYRPGRWSDDAILEEHEFAQELAALEIPVVPPVPIGGRTLLRHRGYRFAVYPRQGGRWPELQERGDREWSGRFIARIHAAGRSRPFVHRPTLGIERYGNQARDYLLQHGFIPDHLLAAYRTLTDDLLAQVTALFGQAGNVARIRLHGDCHPGNILWTDDGPHFVDLDDCLNGPAVQDLWMLLSGTRSEMQGQLLDLLEGYGQFCTFNPSETLLIEPLRTLRMIHYAAWLARRWHDPAFPRAFPWFNSTQYWETHILSLREQAGALAEPPLSI